MALLTARDIEDLLETNDDDLGSHDTLYEILIDGIVSIYKMLNGSNLASATYTEYHSTNEYCDMLVLKNKPITSITSVHDDPEWNYDTATLIDASNYTYDEEGGILYYDGYFYKGKNNVKVVYVAGYTSATLPDRIKLILLRQILHWYKQIKDRSFDIQTRGGGSAAGSTTMKMLQDNLLPEFIMLAETERA